MAKHEEQIGVKIPGQGHHMVRVLVGALESDEEVLQRISTAVGTIFNVLGTKYEVVSSSPFKLKKLKSSEDEGEETEAEEPEPQVVTAPEPVPEPEPEPEPEVEAVPPPPPSEKRISNPALPQIGERWKPRDPRRKASFVVTAIEGEHAVTDDGRRVQLARFWRYERLEEAKAKVS